MPPTSRYEKLSDAARKLIDEAIRDDKIETKTVYGLLIDLGYSASELGSMSGLKLYLQRQREKLTGKKTSPQTRAGDVAKRLAAARNEPAKKAKKVTKKATVKPVKRKAAPEPPAVVVPETARGLAKALMLAVAHGKVLDAEIAIEIAVRLVETEVDD